MTKIDLNEKQIENIINLYLNEKWSCENIGKLYGLSKKPINRILRESGILRKGQSNGKKIILTEKQISDIKNLYLIENKTLQEISEILNLKKSFIDKYLSSVNYRRTKSEAASISLTKRVITPQIIENMKKGQRNLILSGKRKQTGGVCKFYVVKGLKCQGTSEKKYIEHLIQNKKQLPLNCTYIKTPYGAYYPDFKYDEKYVEIKSKYTFDILLGIKKIDGVINLIKHN